MRHHRRTMRLGRTGSERKALVESLVGSLLKHQEITTTLPKAKVAKRLADRVITLGKKDSLSARRQVFSYLQDHDLTSKVFREVAPRFKNRSGGYTRILQLYRRKGDGATMALLELTEKEIKAKEIAQKPAKKAAGHAHAGHEEHPKNAPAAEKELPHQKHPEVKKEKSKPGFFKNLTRFFRNKGGG